jgi:hypothetical protein
MEEKTRNKTHQRASFGRISFVLAMVLMLFVGAVSPVFADTVGSPVIEPVTVVPGAYVYVKISNLPVNTDFTVTEGPAGSRGLYGGIVSHFNSGAGGTQFFLFETHNSVRSNSSVDIRIDTEDGMAAFATFANTQKMIQKDAGVVEIPVTGGTTAAPIRSAISVLSVQKGGVVQVEIYNMPKNIEFSVSMSTAGQKKGGAFVGHVTRVSDLDALVTTFEIPTDVKNADTIDLHLTAPGYSYFVNFVNADT